MVISKLFSELFTEAVSEEIFRLVNFNISTMEFSFNEIELNERNWVYGALDDSTFDDDDQERLIKKTSFIKKYYCVDLYAIQKKESSFKNSIVHIFENTDKDWIEILSYRNQYTVWESIIFSHPPFDVFIIKPWSVGYNLLVGGNDELVRSICTSYGWWINEKHPISPV
ncbi:hypothetical protein [Stenoxybacter acetivorans]|uniref:hypothetical protein n=1 Tax=Stenoxybacter acetivorans TaxID=422441 RepID=UPI00056D6E13|nr:hypothetical protein [Stenoxybacter acetivorans]